MKGTPVTICRTMCLRTQRIMTNKLCILCDSPAAIRGREFDSLFSMWYCIQHTIVVLVGFFTFVLRDPRSSFLFWLNRNDVRKCSTSLPNNAHTQARGDQESYRERSRKCAAVAHTPPTPQTHTTFTALYNSLLFLFCLDTFFHLTELKVRTLCVSPFLYIILATAFHCGRTMEKITNRSRARRCVTLRTKIVLFLLAPHHLESDDGESCAMLKVLGKHKKLDRPVVHVPICWRANNECDTFFKCKSINI